MKRGFEKCGGDRTPTSSGVPQRNVYTSGRPSTLSKSVYGATPKQTVTRDANAMGGSRQTHVLGKRD